MSNVWIEGIPNEVMIQLNLVNIAYSSINSTVMDPAFIDLNVCEHISYSLGIALQSFFSLKSEALHKFKKKYLQKDFELRAS